ncbi:hypothetical protein FI667_g1910, partial [Globisporangium splendens]
MMHPTAFHSARSASPERAKVHAQRHAVLLRDAARVRRRGQSARDAHDDDRQQRAQRRPHSSAHESSVMAVDAERERCAAQRKNPNAILRLFFYLQRAGHAEEVVAAHLVGQRNPWITREEKPFHLSDASRKSIKTEMRDRTLKVDTMVVDNHYNYEFSLSADALDAHRQVLEMAATIEILTRDFENQQQELLGAYKRLEQYTDYGPTSPTEKSMAAKLFRHGYETGDDNDSCDVALHQRNEYRIEFERAEAVIKEFRSMHVNAIGQHRTNWKIHPTVSNMAGYHASGVAMLSTHASLAPGHASSGGESASFTMGAAGAIEVPRNQRFDNESAYQRKENDDLF